MRITWCESDRERRRMTLQECVSPQLHGCGGQCTVPLALNGRPPVAVLVSVRGSTGVTSDWRESTVAAERESHAGGVRERFSSGYREV